MTFAVYFGLRVFLLVASKMSLSVSISGYVQIFQVQMIRDDRSLFWIASFPVSGTQNVFFSFNKWIRPDIPSIDDT